MLVHPLLRRFVVMSGGHWTFPTGGPAIRLKNKKKKTTKKLMRPRRPKKRRSVTFSLLFLQPVKMPTYQYPCSLVAQFTEDIYKNSGASDVLPLVMKSLDAAKVLGMQFLRAGRVRLTFGDPETCSTVLEFGIHVKRPSVRSAVDLVIVPRPVRSLVAAGAVVSPDMWQGSVLTSLVPPGHAMET